jgi:Reverse transcriptase (RNA-dependent DNA polymerase)
MPEAQDENELLEAAVYTKHVPKWEKIVCFQVTALLATMLASNPEMKSFQETKQTQDSSNWCAAITTEFQNMEQMKVWEVLPKNQSLQTEKLWWVYTKKTDGWFRARCVAKGFSQIPGKEFQRKHALVVSETTLHLLLAIKTEFNLSSGQSNIETAFLYGELKEEVWMEIPDGYPKYTKEKHNIIVDPKTQCLELPNAIYGLVQAARQWGKKFKEVLVDTPE